MSSYSEPIVCKSDLKTGTSISYTESKWFVFAGKNGPAQKIFVLIPLRSAAKAQDEPTHLRSLTKAFAALIH